MITLPQKLIAVFGSEITNETTDRLCGLIRCGYTVFALDSQAALFASKANLSWVTLDTYLGSDALYHVATLAGQMEWSWYAERREEFLHNDVCWPEFDRDAMNFFWRETTIAARFMEAFAENGGIDIQFLSDPGRTYTLWYLRSNVWRDVIDLFLNRFRSGGGAEYFPISAFAAEVGKETESMYDPAPVHVFGPAPRHGKKKRALNYSNKIIFALNPGELYRFTPVIMDLKKCAPVQVNLVFPGDEQEWAAKLGVPVFSMPHMDPSDHRIGDKFYTAFMECQRASAGRPWHNALLLDYHFEYYCKNRWPSLSALLTCWERIWENEKPAVVIVSSLMDAESQLPAEAANRYGIETFSIPHGKFGRIKNIQSAKNILYDFQPYKDRLVKLGVAAERCIASRNIINDYTYPTHETVPQKQDARIKILVLVARTYAFDPGNHLFTPCVSIGQTVDTLKILGTIPPDLSDDVDILFKVVPTIPEVETLEMAGIDSNSLLPIESNLLQVLDNVDVVVDLHMGSCTAVLHCVKKGKPIIFFWKGAVRLYDLPLEVFLEAGELVQTETQIWDVLRELARDPARFAALQKKAAAFSAEYLPTENYPELSKIIESFMRKQLTGGVIEDSARGSGMNNGHGTSGIINIDADPSFYYGEISEDHLNWIFAQNENFDDIETATHNYCNETHNEYFRKYALDPRRALYLGLCGSVEGLSLLDYGCGLGSLGIPAACAGARVTFVDSCLPRLRFASIRSKQKNLTETSFYGCKTWRSLPFTPGSFDLIVLNGIMEWVPKTIGAAFETVLEAQLDFLKVMAGLLKPTGRIFLAIENRFALQYLMGYPEDHTDIKYLSIMPRKEANELHRQQKGDDFVTWTWGYEDYRCLLPKVGLILAEEYGMFPDYRFPQLIAPLQDTAAVKRGMLLEEYEAPVEERRRMIDYLAEMGQLHQAVYSFGFILRKSEN